MGLQRSIYGVATGGGAVANNTIIWLGDSITGNGGGPLSPTIKAALDAASTAYDLKQNYSRGFWVWAQSLLGQRLRTIYNAGQGGNTSADVLARVQSDVVAFKPGWCHVQAGTNDVAQNIPPTTTQANLTAVWDALDAAGIRIIMGTIQPRGSYTGGQRAQLELLNVWIKNQGRTRKNLLVVDYHAVLVNATGGTPGIYAAGTAADQAHPSTVGAYYMGLALASALSPLLAGTPCPFLVSGEGDAANLLTAGRFGQGGNGAVITGWGMALGGGVTLTYAKVPRTDIASGSWQSIVCPVAASSGFTLSGNANVGAGLAIGDTVVGVLEYQLSNLDTAGTAGSHNFNLALAPYNGVTLGTAAQDLNPSDIFPTASRSGVLVTPPITVPAGTTLMQLQIVAHGGGTYLLDRAGICNLTQLSIAA